ncbi:hypothetical protein GC722_11880 [Auraticoccus sp. F435]|uniref:Uncharacterized protein n=1 Tax=Auraticoccus cholistanensis TaxID=2656650 RepID=A0A6A9UUU8_9ACTN|nr:hypothetical protein [Auraticoccus cholistanensis]MVA76716.1 hypothetical protein [Auraticoccus cholistanensis]
MSGATGPAGTAPTPQPLLPRRALAVVAVLAWLALVVQLGLLGWSLLGGPGEGGRPPGLVPALVAAAVPTLLVALLASVLARAARPTAGAVRSAAGQGPAAATPGRELETPEPPQTEQQAPVWAPDEAAGAVWTTAEEAARGAGASSWGSSQDPAGWAPADRPERGRDPARDPGPRDGGREQ